MADPTTVLPPEIVSEIFELCFPQDTRFLGCVNQAPINVSQVSRHWRDVATSTPKLWMGVIRSEFNAESIPSHEGLDEMLRLRGLKAGGLLIIRSPHRYLEAADEMNTQWRKHYLCLPRLVNGRHVLALDSNLVHQSDVLHTKNLHLSVDIQQSGTDNKSGGNGLQKSSKLRLLYFTLGDVEYSMDSFGAFDMGPLLSLVHGAFSYLSHISFTLSPNFNVELGDHFQPEEMPNLRSLTLAGSVPATRNFLDHLTTPVLEILQLEFHKGGYINIPIDCQDWSWIVHFLIRSRPPLIELKINVDAFEPRVLRGILLVTPKLRNLTMLTGVEEGFELLEAARRLGVVVYEDRYCPDLREVRLTSIRNNCYYLIHYRGEGKTLMYQYIPLHKKVPSES